MYKASKLWTFNTGAPPSSSRLHHGVTLLDMTPLLGILLHDFQHEEATECCCLISIKVTTSMEDYFHYRLSSIIDYF